MAVLGIIGAGHIGTAVARAAIAAGYDVVISNSRGPESLIELVAELGPRARAATPAEAALAADEAVVVTIPLGRIAELPVEALGGTIVLDTNNYYFERDGRIESLDRGEATVSGLLQEMLPESKVAKAFNNIRSSEIETDGSPAGTPGRRALGTASDFPDATAWATTFYDQLGYDTVDLGPLSESWRLERDRPGYGKRQTREEMLANTAAANRVP